jgi:hypothetical protein
MFRDMAAYNILVIVCRSAGVLSNVDLPKNAVGFVWLQYKKGRQSARVFRNQHTLRHYISAQGLFYITLIGKEDWVIASE